MTVHVPDRFKAADAFWIGLGKIGLTPAAVLSQARVPLTVYGGKKNLVTTAQCFALWRTVGELSADPAAGLKSLPRSTLAISYYQLWRSVAPMTTGIPPQIKVSKTAYQVVGGQSETHVGTDFGPGHAGIWTIGN